MSVVDNNGTVISEANHIGNLNPFRYRGYYYDNETGYYYLNSRYYDPETGRFINADDVSYINPEIINGLNLYAIENSKIVYQNYVKENNVRKTNQSTQPIWNWTSSNTVYKLVEALKLKN